MAEPTALRTLTNKPGVTEDLSKTSIFFASDWTGIKNWFAYVLGLIPSTREILTASRTYYVRTDGNNANSGLVNNSGGAFLTIQKAVDVVAALDLNGQAVVIQVGDGTYTNLTVLKNCVGYAYAGQVLILGNSGNMASVVIHTTGNDCFLANGLSTTWRVEYMKLTTTTSGNCFDVVNGSSLIFGFIDFGDCAARHMQIQNFSTVTCDGNYTISGGAILHFQATCSSLNIISFTITLSGTPAFSYVYGGSTFGSVVMHHVCTFSGSATGGRYDVSGNSVIYCGGSATYFPGNAVGTIATGGQYF